MIANPCFHSWRQAQRLVNPTEIVVHAMGHHRVLQIRKVCREVRSASSSRSLGRMENGHYNKTSPDVLLQAVDRALRDKETRISAPRHRVCTRAFPYSKWYRH
jgi:hypothetical protein